MAERKKKSLLGRMFLAVVGLTTLGVLGVLSYGTFQAGRTIYDLLTESKELRRAIANLTQEDQIGYARVLSQEERDGKLYTRLLFVETARTDPTQRLLEKEYLIEGDVVHFDALIVKFGDELVMEGEEKSLYLWRRVYGENQPPNEGYPIEEPGLPPARYEALTAELSLDEEQMFWDEIWKLSDDPGRLREAGIDAIYGNVVYKSLKPGLIYIFKIDNTGALHPEVVPAL